MTVAFKRPPQSANLPPLTLALELTGTGATGQFSLPGGMTPLPLGPVIVTATAQNIAALKGTATIGVGLIAVRNRFVVGGARLHGEFQYGLLGACAIAIYEHGAISGRNGGAIVIRGDILTKWLSLRGPFDEPGWLAVRRNEEADALAGARSQPLSADESSNCPRPLRRRVFSSTAVFADAIDLRGGDPGIGLPLGDPSDSVGPLQTLVVSTVRPPGRRRFLCTFDDGDSRYAAHALDGAPSRTLAARRSGCG